MYRTIVKSEIYPLTITRARLHSADSITIDADLFDAADLRPGEQVAIACSTNGARLETYAVKGERGTGIVALSGPAVHLIRTGDQIAIASYASILDSDAASVRRRVIVVDRHNRHIDPDGPTVRISAGNHACPGALPA